MIDEMNPSNGTDEGLTQIVYRHRMDRVPTLEDRKKRVGLMEFVEVLREHGWVDENYRGLKRFRLRFEGYAEKGNNYIEWTAFLRQES